VNRREALTALGGLAAVGCGVRAAFDGLVLWHAYRGGEKAALHAAVDGWRRANDNLPVRLVSIPFDAFANKVSVAIPRGNGPDLLIFGHDRIGDWASRGLLARLGFWTGEAGVARFFKRTVDALIYRDSLYGLPLAFKTLALFYNRALIATPPATTDALIAQCKQVRAADADRWGVAWELDSLYFHAPWLHGFGGAVYADERDTLAVDSPAAQASAEFVRRLLVTEKIIPEEATSALITTLFRDQKLACVVSGPWFRGELKGHQNWGVAPLPRVSTTGKPARPFLGVEAVMVSARSTRKRAAFALAQALTGDAAAKARMGGGGQLVANRAAYADLTDPIAKAFREQVEQTEPLSNRPHMRRVWTPMQRALSQAIVQGEPAKTALTRARRAIEKADQPV
jgi:maltose-binding protein MalE